MLRNHGTLAVGETPAAAFLRIFFLERACKMQVLAQAGGDLLEWDVPDAAYPRHGRAR
jgi:ribulose-5-phosphate 4-epimerase/fuculose-1-phosphate aldolase